MYTVLQSWSYSLTTSTMADAKWEPSGDNMTEHMRECHGENQVENEVENVDMSIFIKNR